MKVNARLRLWFREKDNVTFRIGNCVSRAGPDVLEKRKFFCPCQKSKMNHFSYRSEQITACVFFIYCLISYVYNQICGLQTSQRSWYARNQNISRILSKPSVLGLFSNSDNALNTVRAEIEKVVDYEHKHRLWSIENPRFKVLRR